MDRIQIRANAKINLTLDILGRREDGYHDIRSVMQSVSLCDLVDVRLTGDGGLRVTCDGPALPEGRGNLACRAAEAYFAGAGVRNPGIAVHIRKRIPMAAGLAGGSADAAAVLLGLDRLLGAGAGGERLAQIGRRVGADVPFCLTGGTMLAEGVGDRLTPAPPLPDCHLLLAKPAESISTREAYEQFDRRGGSFHPAAPLLLEALERRDLPAVGDLLYNAMERLAGLPAIRRIEERMLDAGAYGARMSGSGSAVFGLFAYLYNAERCGLGLEAAGIRTFIAAPARHGCETDGGGAA